MNLPPAVQVSNEEVQQVHVSLSGSVFCPPSVSIMEV